MVPHNICAQRRLNQLWHPHPSSLSACRNFASLAIKIALTEDSVQTARIRLAHISKGTFSVVTAHLITFAQDMIIRIHHIRRYLHSILKHQAALASRPRWLIWMRRPTGDQLVAGFNPRRGRQHSFVEIDHEIFSTVILSLPLIQEGQLSVSGERMCTILVNRLED